MQTDLGGTWELYQEIEDSSGNINKIYKIQVDTDAWQLFVDDYEQIPARWPNANFLDGSVFDYEKHWAEGTMDRDKTYNPDTYPYVNGELIDLGPLAESGLDPTGAIAILNIGSFKTTSEKVKSWDASTGKFTYEPVDDSDYMTKHHYYFLEQKLEFIDQPGEWYNDPETKTIYYMPPTGQNPKDMNIRAKTQAFALKFYKCESVNFDGFKFFATTFYTENSRHSVYKNLRLTYPSTSKRSLGIAREEKEKERYITKFLSAKNQTVERSAFLYTDGGAVEFYGSGYHKFKNNYLYHIDWSVSDLTNLGATVTFQGSYNEITHNTIHQTGASQTLIPGSKALVTHNHIYDAAYLQTDGSCIHLMIPQQEETVVSNNWVHDTQFYAIRLDGPIDGTNDGRNTTVINNVAWNCAGGLIIKGNDHLVTHNTVFGVEPYHEKAGALKNNIIFTDGADNTRTYSGYNAGNTISGSRNNDISENPIPGYNEAGTDWNGYVDEGTVEEQLIDIQNFNFCPVPGSEMANRNAGAYEADCSNPWVAGHDWDEDFTRIETGPEINEPIPITEAPPTYGPCQDNFSGSDQLDDCNDCCLNTYETLGFDTVISCYNRCYHVSGSTEPYISGIVELLPNGGNEDIQTRRKRAVEAGLCHGTGKFVQTSENFVTVHYEFWNCFPTGEHGLHIHKKSDFSEGCASTSWHWNPTGAQHPNRLGDFGNVVMDEFGYSEGYIVSDILRLDQPKVVGKALVLHEGPDDFITETSAGAGIACGEIFEDSTILDVPDMLPISETTSTTVTETTTTTVPETTTTTVAETTTNVPETTTTTMPDTTTAPETCNEGDSPIGSPYYVDAINGNDNFSGTSNCPFKTVSAAAAILENDDTVYVRDGTYHEFAEFDSLKRIKVLADGDNVLFDGSLDVQTDLGGTWELHQEVNDGSDNKIYKITVDRDAWQLFVDKYEQVPARWPNANFTDGTVWDYADHWAEGTIDRDQTYGESASVPYVNGELIDLGPLVESGIDPTGSIAILNIGSWMTTSERVTSWDPSTAMFTYVPVETANYQTKHHYYFLEQKLELLDFPGEWYSDPETRTIYFMPPTGMHPKDMDIRAKTQAFAVNFNKCREVVFDGFKFFATTFKSASTKDSVFSNNILTYPSTSKRGLGIAREDVKERYLTRFDSATNITVTKCAFMYTDGPAIEFWGPGGHKLSDNYFYHIDWSVADITDVGQAIHLVGDDNEVSWNSIHKTGSSQTIITMRNSYLAYNHIWDAAYLQTDGAPIHFMQPHQSDSEIAYNWVHDTQFYGIRLDGLMDSPNMGRNCTVHHNLAWNTNGGMIIKGNDHNVTHNMAFGVTPYHEKSYGEKNDIIFTSGVNGEDSAPEDWADIDPDLLDNSRTYSGWNAANNIAGDTKDSADEYPVPGIREPGTDWNGFYEPGTIEEQLMDIENWNFCPKPDSEIAKRNAGAYDAECVDFWVPGHTWDVGFVPTETGPIITAPPTEAPPTVGPCQEQFGEGELDDCNNCCEENYATDSLNSTISCYNRCLYHSNSDYVYTSGRVEMIPNGGGITDDDDLNANPCHGIVTFVETSELYTTLFYEFFQCAPLGNHGMHVHKKAEFTEGCASTSWHFNPHGAPHGPQSGDKDQRRAGAFGNIVMDANGYAKGYLRDHVVRLSGGQSVFNRALVVHEDEDEYRNDWDAGLGLACGEIVEDSGILDVGFDE